jgi:hypothetical protein
MYCKLPQISPDCYREAIGNHAFENKMTPNQQNFRDCMFSRLFALRHLLVFFFLLITAPLFAHDLAAQLEKEPAGNVIFFYLTLGFEHILPLGIDHILFVAGLFLLSSSVKNVIWQATAFTFAHSITLILTMNGVIAPSPSAVEPIIALSIAFIAIENILIANLKPWRLLIVFLFGLIHGMGFAGALNEYGLPPNLYYTSLLSFNIGVELGQIAVIFLAWVLIGKWFHSKKWYRNRIVIPLSCCIAVIAMYWTVERTLFN